MTKAAHFEAKKHAYRQTQDGIVISFVVHPNDVTSEMATAPLGTRYMVAFAQIGDDEQPKQEKPKQSWASMSFAQQAGVLCADYRFRLWLARNGTNLIDEADAAHMVREHCGVKSRADIATNPAAVAKWQDLVSRYREATGQMAEMRG